ncbi:MAG: hypothetical protein RL264_158 [Bacteroidota bacterium]|jgi:hypothetical protein
MQFKNFPTFPNRLQTKIEAAQQESDEYAADELVNLGEEILSQLAAMGMAAYLQQENQNETLNDFVISLFLSNGHEYNAGPLYRYVANMLKEVKGEHAELLRPFFWETDAQGNKVLNNEIHHLATLRNDVMHGFFVLPPEKNREIAQQMEGILSKFIDAGLFTTEFGVFHFCNKEGFTGQWNVVQDKEWELLVSTNKFGVLAKRISYEYSSEFITVEQKKAHETYVSNDGLQVKTDLLLQKGKGALISWFRPSSENGLNAYRQWVQTPDSNMYLPIYYTINEQGATFTATFLEQVLRNVLQKETGKEIKDVFKFLKDKNNGLAKKPILILHNLHLGLFNQNHLTKLFNACYEVSMPILATAWHYPYLKRFINVEFENYNGNNDINKELISSSLHNYIRFKGVNGENNQEKEKEAISLLEKIVFQLNETLEQNKQVVARRFADEHEYPIEFVHEAFSILSPFYQLNREEFIKDEVDELYGFPKTIEESSRIFLSLGRRDVKLEYKHKVLIKS